MSSVAKDVVLDTLHHDGCDQFLDSQERIALQGPDGGSEAAVSTLQQRLELLNGLPLGDLSAKTCVDFGVGTRGFGASFPKLKHCGRAIGIDIARAALASSARLSARGKEPYGTNYTYLTSRGDKIELDSESVDLFHACESIERVENAEILFEEVHRVLKPGGMFVAATRLANPETPYSRKIVSPEPAPGNVPGTPDSFAAVPAQPMRRPSSRQMLSGLARMIRANPPLRRLARFVKRSVLRIPASVPYQPGGPEPFAALTFGELKRYLEPRFELLQAHGYGGSHSGRRSGTGETAPENSSHVVLLARRRDADRPLAGFRQQRYHHEWPFLRYRGGPWEVLGLRGAMTGRLALGGPASWLTLDFEGTDLILYFWASPQGGEAIVEVDGTPQAVNLFSPTERFRRVHRSGFAAGRHALKISGSRVHDSRSTGNQVVFYQALAYQRDDGSPPSTAPGRRLRGRTIAEVEELRRKVAARPWFHSLDFGDGIITPGVDPSIAKIGYLGIPERLDGLEVLDIGAYDGFFSFLCESRGARRVVAADHFCWSYGGMATKDGFDLAKAVYGSMVEERFLPVEELSPENVGTFDLVLFLGVLYHAPDMLRYLRAVRPLCRNQLILETEIDAEDYPLPAAVYYPGAALNNDASNFWGPNIKCVTAMLQEVGFRRIELLATYNIVHRPRRAFHRAVFHAFV